MTVTCSKGTLPLSLWLTAIHRLLAVILALVLGLTLSAYAGERNKRIPGSSSHLPAYALAVKSPYLSTWLSGEFEKNVTNARPQFWTEEPITWNIVARVGDVGAGSAITYNLFGRPDAVVSTQPATQVGSVNYTSTHTYVKLQAGEVQFTLDFFSPVSPNDLLRQSLPYSYLTVEVSAPPKQTDIQILSAIDHSWTAQGPDIQANINTNGNTSYFTLGKADAVNFAERDDRAIWGTTVFGTQTRQPSNLSIGCDTPQGIYSTFAQTGGVTTQKHEDGCKGDALFSLAHQLKGVQDTATVTYGIGLYRESVVSYLDKPQAPYFRSQYRDIPSSLNAFFADYQGAWEESQSLDKLVRTQATQIAGANYSDILEASVRQTFGSLEVVIPSDTLSTSPLGVNAFIKEISSNGNVNTIDVIYPTFPIVYVLSPQWIKLLLQPVLSYLATPTGVWDKNEVPHDMGNHYPNATGHNDNKLEDISGREELMPIESTGQMFTLLHAYIQATKDYDFIKGYMGSEGKYILTTYADMLVKNGTFPTSQLTTVDALEPVANTTQLAMTAAIAVSAFGTMSNMTNYTTAGAEMTKAILDNRHGAMDAARTHFTYDYHNDASFSVMFPLFSDKLMSLPSPNTFAPAYGVQSNFYRGLLDDNAGGMPYSEKHPWGITDWIMWGAATSAPDVSKRIMDTTHEFLRTMRNGVVFGTKYVVSGEETGKWIANTARPTVGSNFALWALKGHSFKF